MLRVKTSQQAEDHTMSPILFTICEYFHNIDQGKAYLWPHNVPNIQPGCTNCYLYLFLNADLLVNLVHLHNGILKLKQSNLSFCYSTADV